LHLVLALRENKDVDPKWVDWETKYNEVYRDIPKVESSFGSSGSGGLFGNVAPSIGPSGFSIGNPTSSSTSFGSSGLFGNAVPSIGPSGFSIGNPTSSSPSFGSSSFSGGLFGNAGGFGSSGLFGNAVSSIGPSGFSIGNPTSSSQSFGASNFSGGLNARKLSKSKAPKATKAKAKNPIKKKKPKNTKKKAKVESAGKGRDKSRFNIYIYKVLKQVHPDASISQNSMMVMDDFAKDMFLRILREIEIICEMNEKRTITTLTVQTAVRIVLPGQLAKHSVSEGTKAVTKYASHEKSGRQNQSARAGLTFPVAKVKKLMRERGYLKFSISKTAPVYLAATLEYLCSEVLELGGNAARDSGKIRILPHHLVLALRNDEELNKLTKNCVICGGGVLPYIAVQLFPKNSEPTEGATQSY